MDIGSMKFGYTGLIDLHVLANVRQGATPTDRDPVLFAEYVSLVERQAPYNAEIAGTSGTRAS